MTTKHKPGQTVYWLSLDHNYLGDCLPIVHINLPRIHSGKIVKADHRTVTIEAFINEDFLKNFKGVVSGLKLLKKKKGSLQAAQFILHTSNCYDKMSEVQMKIIEFVIKDFESDIINF